MRKVSMKRKSRSKGAKEDDGGSSNEDRENGSVDSVDEDTEINGDENGTEPSEKKSKRSKSKGKKSRKHSQETDDNEDDDDADYEVQDIVDEKMEKGVHLYLIRWKGYDASGDTWEPENTLSCPDIVKRYHDKHGHKNFKKAKGPKGKKGKKGAPKTKEPEEDWDENEEFEVEKIIEVHHRRGGGREFLVQWKGYPNSESTWEPEDNLNCTEMIEKFMKKVDNLKDFDSKNLRAKRKHTDFFTLSTNDTGRRLSKRQKGKQRVHYHDAE